jgi:hypothetical protein
MADEPADDYVAGLTAAQRVALVWEVTKSQWMWQSGSLDEPPFRRDVERVIRGVR